MELMTASAFPMAQLTHLWNRGYAEYFVPVTFTEAMFENWIRCGDFDLSQSLVLTDQRRPVGFSMAGIRGRRAWIGGFGIAADYRGRGFAQALFSEHVSRLQAAGFESIQLEVLVQNWARKVYERAGLAVVRRLGILQGRLEHAAAPFAEVSPAKLLTNHARLHEAEPAVWQREPGWLAKSLPAEAIGLCTGSPSEPDAFALCLVSGESVRVADAAASGPEAAACLAGALAVRFPGATISLLNEPEGSPVDVTFRAAGLTEVMAQHEMRWEC